MLVDAQVVALVRRRDLVGAEQEAIRDARDHPESAAGVAGVATMYFATSFHEMSK